MVQLLFRHWSGWGSAAALAAATISSVTTGTWPVTNSFDGGGGAGQEMGFTFSLCVSWGAGGAQGGVALGDAFRLGLAGQFGQAGLLGGGHLARAHLAQTGGFSHAQLLGPALGLHSAGLFQQGGIHRALRRGLGRPDGLLFRQAGGFGLLLRQTGRLGLFGLALGFG